MQIEFVRPWALVLIPVMVVLICVIRIAKKKINSKVIGELVVRSVVVTLLVLAFSGISIRKQSDVTTTVFLIDMSDSLKDNWKKEIEFVRESIAKMPSKNETGIVVFGADAQIEQFVTDKKAFTDAGSKVIGTATDIEQAVTTAMALFPDGSAKRLVLLTDGAENEGNVADIATSVAGADIEVKVKSYDSSVDEEVYVSGVELPETISKGDKFEVNVDIYASEATNAKVSLYSGRTLKGQKEVALQKGDNKLVFSDQGVENGIKSYRVVVESDKDTVSVNNTYSAFTKVEAPAKLLLVEGEKDESLLFQEILQACNYEYEVVTPSGVPGSISDMLRYQSVVLLDVYGDDLRKGFMDTLQTYIKDYAGGLAVIGGQNSYALGNYRNTPLEEVLPVKMDLEGEKEIPKIAMIMVIDHSGSMESSSTGNGNITCLDVAKQAAINSLDSLREIDEVGVVAFDDTYTWAVDLQAATDKGAIEENIAAIPGGGGTSIYPAVEAAMARLKKSDATIKHIVLLTDGQDGYNEYDALIEEMGEQKITLSSVAIGQDADEYTLETLAENCGGRYYYSDAGTALPRIFAQEVYLSTQEYLINEEFTPVITNTHDILSGVFDDGSPSLLGYIATSPKDTAKVLLESHKGDPVLACWQYGLGHSVAWTSDGTNQWTGNFAGWDNYATLWRNIIDWTICDDELGDDNLYVEQNASKAVITYDTDEYSADTSLSAVITDEEGNQTEAGLIAVSPGKYQAEVPLDETGVYSVNVRKEEGKGDSKEVIKSLNTATAMQYSQEYRFGEVTNNIGNFVNQVKGIYIDQSKEVFNTKLKGAMTRTQLTLPLMLIAVILFVLDIIFRRMHIDWIHAGMSKVNENARILREYEEKTREKAKQKRKTEIKNKPQNLNADKNKNEKVKKNKKANISQPIDTAALLKKKEDRNL